MTKKILILTLSLLTITLVSKAQVELISSGTGSAYTLTVPGVFSLRNGIQVTFKAHANSSAAATINVSGSGALSIMKEGGSNALTAGDIKTGQIVTIAYDGSKWQMMNPIATAPAVPTNYWSPSGSDIYNNNGGNVTVNADNSDGAYKMAIGKNASSVEKVLALTNTNNFVGGGTSFGFRSNFGGTLWDQALISGITGAASASGDLAFSVMNNRTASTIIEAMRIQGSTGNVGIGTSTPQNKLHVNGAATTTYTQMTNNATGQTSTDGLTMGLNGAGAGFISYWEPNDFKIQTNAINALWIASNGYVGVGTAAAPSTNLHVQGNARVTGLVGPGTVIADASGNLSVAAGGTITGGGTTNYVAKWTPTGVELGTSLIYDNTSVVGIGTGASPSSSRLHVHSTSGAGNLRLTSAATLQSATDGFSMSNDGSNIIYMTQHENAPWYFVTNGSTTAMTILSSGLVGIGTTPATTLDVANSTVVTTSRFTNTLSSASPKMAVYGWAYGTGTGNNSAGAFDASGSTGTNYAVYGAASGNSGAKTAVYGNATGTGTNIGGYFSASGGTTNNALQLVDGSQANNRVLTSNASGVATWTDLSTISSGSTAWTRSTPNIYPTTLTDNVGIGVATPTEKLEVSGNVEITSTANGFMIANDTILRSNGSTSMYIGQTGGSGGYGVYAGFRAGNVSTGVSNTFVGTESGEVNTTGAQNAFFGLRSGRGNTTGAYNTFIGRDAGTTNTTGSNNTMLGYGADVTSGVLTYASAIGYGATIGQSYGMALGGTGANALEVGIGINNNMSGKLHVYSSTSTYDIAGTYYNSAVYGEVTGAIHSSRGIMGVSWATGNYGIGAYGSAGGAAANNYGVYGNATGGTTNYAGYFDAGDVYVTNNLGIGVVPTYKVHTESSVAGATVLYSENTYVGNSDGRAVQGISNNASNYGYGGFFQGGYRAVYGAAQHTANSGAGIGGYFIGNQYGVYGSGNGGSAAGTICGVYGLASGTAGTRYGVYGGTSGAGGTYYAGWFQGNVNVTGTLSKGGGTFKIDHPLDPQNKYLYHSFVESPDMMNIYNGNVTTNSSGIAEVTLPAYFEALNMEYRYQLTVIGDFAQAIILEKVSGNKFKIKTDKPSIEVSWQVTGVRKDPFANKNRVVPEVEKEAENKGKYVHPEAYGVSPEKGIGYIKEESEERDK